MQVLIERETTRAALGGTGSVKVGGNYAASMNSIAEAHKKGYATAVYLDAKEKKYIDEFNTTLYKSYNSIMHGYVLIPDSMLDDLDKVAKYLDESYDYVMSLESK